MHVHVLLACPSGLEPSLPDFSVALPCHLHRRCDNGFCAQNGCTTFSCWDNSNQNVCKIDGTGCAVSRGGPCTAARPGDVLSGGKGIGRPNQGFPLRARSVGCLIATLACAWRLVQACSSGIVVRCPTGMCCGTAGCQTVACSGSQTCCEIRTSSCSPNPSFTNTARKCSANCQGAAADPLFRPALYSTYST